MTTEIEPTNAAHHVAIADIWNAACGESLSITPRFAEFNLRPTTGVPQVGRFAVEAGKPIGFVVASAVPGQHGWIDAMAVHPMAQRQGIGSALLAWAETWLGEQGCPTIRLGGSLRPFTAGLPAELNSATFFRARGYVGDGIDVDLACNLATDLRAHPAAHSVEVAPLADADVPALHEFLRRAFPGRWHFEFEEFLREGGRPADYMVLWAEDSGTRRVEAFCQTTRADSLRPLDRFYLHGLPRPWGQLGSIGVDADCRGKGYAAALINGALAHLRDLGVRGCIIDWTTLISFYEKFGFRVHRQYAMLSKTAEQVSR